MGCVGCSVATTDNGKEPKGCKSNGGCATGGCNRMNTYDWLSHQDIEDSIPFGIAEVTFKNGSRKAFYLNPPHTQAITGDFVVVETGNGYDVGAISLSGDLVRLQMKKKKVDEGSIIHQVIRVANERDLEKMQKARELEKPAMIRARAIARTLDLDMKVGDVEFQGDKRKATFYYTADGRIDFRELIRHFAKEFRVKIEMRQIGARQESARIGGIGSCGRELCCSTWLTDFKSVSTAAARYQNLAINQAKLSGQCGRLKCCLNYELDSYLDALEHFPKHGEKLHTEAGTAILIKTDIFKGLMFYVYDHERGRGKIYPLKLRRVKEIITLNKAGQKAEELQDKKEIEMLESGIIEGMEYADSDVTGVVELPMEKRRSSRNKRRKSSDRPKPTGERKPKSDSDKHSRSKHRRKDKTNRPVNKKMLNPIKRETNTEKKERATDNKEEKSVKNTNAKSDATLEKTTNPAAKTEQSQENKPNRNNRSGRNRNIRRNNRGKKKE